MESAVPVYIQRANTRTPPVDPETVLTTAINGQGHDDYDYGPRAALARHTKQDLGLDDNEPLPSPWTLEFEPTLLCNNRCHFCSYEADISHYRAIHKEQRLGGGLPKEVVMQVLGAVSTAGTTKGTFWSGGGEPLVWRHIVEAVKFASEFSDVSLQTNGALLHKFTKSPEDLQAIRLLSVSVYGDSAATHEQIAGVNNFDRVISNLRKVRAMRDFYGIELTLSAKVLVDAINYRTIPEIVHFYRNVGVDTVGLRLVQDYNYGGTGQRQTSVELTREQKQELQEVISNTDHKDSSLDSLAATLAVDIPTIPVTTHCYNAIDGHFACIDAWGNVYLGNPEIGNPAYSIGNVLEQPWEDIWKSERHLEVVAFMDRMQKAGKCARSLCRHVRANVGAEKYELNDRPPLDSDTIMSGLGAFL